MTRDVEVCAVEDSIKDMMHRMTSHRIRHLPVVEAGRLVGMVSIGDVVKNRLEELQLETGILATPGWPRTEQGTGQACGGEPPRPPRAQMMFRSTRGRPARRRSGPSAERSSVRYAPWTISSAMPRPTAGACWMPWPEKPLAR